MLTDNVAFASMLMHSLTTPNPLETRTAQDEFAELVNWVLEHNEQALFEMVSKNDVTITELNPMDLEVDYPAYLNRLLEEISDPQP
jgi:hypothetical protein